MKKTVPLIPCILALMVSGSKTSPTRASLSNPLAPYNVILISADAMRADMVGANGNSEIETPTLNRLAKEGINFTRAYCNITTTNPSHTTIFSSLYPQDHKTYDNTSRVSPQIVTLPEILKRFGWTTAGIVNMRWLNHDVGNVLQGIDEFAPCKQVRKADETNRWVFKFLDSRRRQENPFFLFVHYVDTHTPYRAPREYTQLYYSFFRNPKAFKHRSLKEAKRQFPAHLQNNPYMDKWLKGIRDVDYIVATNKGAVTWIDHQIGQLIHRLKLNGQWDKTILVFTSDHGESLGEHGLWFVHGGLFESTARVPLIMRIPGGPKGKQINSVVQHVDLMPTLLNQLNLPIPLWIRGQALLKDPPSDSLMDRAALIEHTGGYLNAVVTSRYKYIKHTKSKTIFPSYSIRKGKEELYDLLKDPGESNNLAYKRPVVRKIMKGLLKKFKETQPMDFEPQKATIDPQTMEMLRSLGYL